MSAKQWLEDALEKKISDDDAKIIAKVNRGMQRAAECLQNIDNIVISVNDPIVLLRVKLMNAPEDGNQRAELFEKLLELNATDASVKHEA